MKTTSCIKNDQIHDRSNNLSSIVSNRNIVKLATIATITAGDPAPRKTEFTKEGKPFVRAGSLSELIDGSAVSNLEKLDDETAKQKKMKLFPAGTVIFAKSGMSCLTGNIYVLPEPCYVVSHLACIITSGELAEYLRYYFEFDKPCTLIENASFPSIRLSKISNMAIPLPDEAEMLRQTAVLKSVDKLKGQYRLQLHKLDNLIKSRFVEMFGNLTNNDKGWSFVELASVCDVRDGTHDSPKYCEDGYPLMTSKNFSQGFADFSSAKFISKDDFDAINKRSKVDVGDIVMPMIGTIGHPVIVDTNRLFAIKNVALLKMNNAGINRTVLKCLLESDYFSQVVESHNRGATQRFISLNNIRGLEIPVIPICLQQEFAAFVSQVDKLRFETQQQIEKLEPLKKSLMQEYFG